MRDEFNLTIVEVSRLAMPNARVGCGDSVVGK